MDGTGLEKTAANYVPLSPLSFLLRTARVYPHRTAVIYGDKRYNWADLKRRCGLLAAALARRGVRRGDVVSYVAANTPELLEAHFAVPMAGGVLNAINTRLDVPTLRYIFSHAESKIIFVDGEFADKVAEAVSGMDEPPLLIDIVDEGERAGVGVCDYETLLGEANGEELCLMPEDEWAPISLNYTSGTTGKPKGVVCHHRGAYLMAMGSVVAWDMKKHETYLQTVPMFHCNGWGYPWTKTLLAGTVVCLRRIDGAEILRLIEECQVDELGGAPIVLTMIAEAGRGKRLSRPVRIMVAAAPPSSTILAAMEEIGFSVTHVYGLTETYGHMTICAWQEEWDALPPAERVEKLAQQGVGYPILEDWAIVSADGKFLPEDGKTVGEIVMRGNAIMSGYLKNPAATEKAFSGGWFRTGDLATMDEGYFRIADRLKDIIISGGENISSVAVENALCKHPVVMLAAVVAKPDDKWGETPCAFVELRPGGETPAEAELIEFCRQHLPGFMRPKTIVFGPLPKTATGKIKKYELREQAKKL